MKLPEVGLPMAVPDEVNRYAGINRQGTTADACQEWMRSEDIDAIYVDRRIKPEPVLSEAHDLAPIGSTGQNLYFPKYSMQFGLSASICESSSYTACARVLMMYYLQPAASAPSGVAVTYVD